MTTRPEFKSRFVFCTIIFAVLFSFALSARVSAQMVGATVTGTVVDPSGSVIPGVKIAIKTRRLGVSQMLSRMLTVSSARRTSRRDRTRFQLPRRGSRLLRVEALP